MSLPEAPPTILSNVCWSEDPQAGKATMSLIGYLDARLTAMCGTGAGWQLLYGLGYTSPKAMAKAVPLVIFLHVFMHLHTSDYYEVPKSDRDTYLKLLADSLKELIEEGWFELGKDLTTQEASLRFTDVPVQSWMQAQDVAANWKRQGTQVMLEQGGVTDDSELGQLIQRARDAKSTNL